MNCAIDPQLDRSKPDSTQLLMAKALGNFMSSNGYVDPWRFRNPSSRQYSFYSHVHQTFSHIDYFFVDARLLPKVTNVAYHPIIVSDHSPVSIDIQISSDYLAIPPCGDSTPHFYQMTNFINLLLVL